MDANNYDFLTDLPTMTCFFEYATAKKESASKNNTPSLLMFISLSGLTSYNRRFGFPEGNKLLKSFADVLTQFFEKDSCCRLGGVHFAVYSEDTHLDDTLHNFLERFKILYGEVSVYPHVGVYSWHTETISVNMACDRAKLACDVIKAEKKGGINYYDQSIRQSEEKYRYIVDNFPRAIAERWITVYYQPIVRTVSGKVCDEEALARWIDPVKGFLSPADFVPILEEEKLIYKLDLYVVERTKKKMKQLESMGNYSVSHSINLSRSDFESCDIVEEIRSRVDLAGIRRNRINIEITESIIGSDFDFMKKQILRFKDLGFSVWMDDFGSGYSSLNVLRDIPFDLIKFDMTFMRQFDQNNNGKIILAELMRMAFAIGVDTVCEGVENEEQLQFLREIGCSKIQGFYYSRPNPLEVILERIKNNTVIGFENPEETKYYETIGRVNLHDLTVITYGNEKDFNNVFNMLPIAIIELTDDSVRFVRTNQSYRNFIQRYFKTAITGKPISIDALIAKTGEGFANLIQRIAHGDFNTFIDGALRDNSVANYFIRKISENPVTKTIALAVGVLSITDASSIIAQKKQKEELEKARREQVFYSRMMALSGDFICIYVVDPETDSYTEYRATSDFEELGIAKQGKNFFDLSHENAKSLIAEKDTPLFIEKFTKEHVLHEIDKKGVFTLRYKLLLHGEAQPVSLRAALVKEGGQDKLIIGIRL